ncbi:carbohydrate sulfotransferase 5, partial [Biomphalaria pfeifferi]
MHKRASPWKKQCLMMTLSVIFICLSTLQIHVQLSGSRAIYLNITSMSYIRHITETRCRNKTEPSWSSSLEPKQYKQVSPRTKVIVLSYMRSGSTFCGDLVQAHPDVFYVYEPLLYLWDYYVPRKDRSFEL